MMKKTIITVFGLLIFSGIVPSVFASCSAPMPVGAEFQNYANADTVFVGMVLDIHNPRLKDNSEIAGYDTVTFDVERVLKGHVDNGKVIDPHSSIGFRDFEVGKSYLVYAFGQQNEVNLCTPPVLLSGSNIILWYEVAHHLPFVIVFAIGGVFALVVMIRRIKENPDTKHQKN